MIRLGKRGELGDQMMIFIFMVTLFIIVGGIALAFNIFYSGELDYRNSDASLLYTTVYRCIESRQITSNFFKDLYKNCGLAENVLIEQKFILEISDETQIYFKQGDSVGCQLQDKNIAYARCTIGKMRANIDGKESIVQIIVGSNQNSRNGVEND